MSEAFTSLSYPVLIGGLDDRAIRHNQHSPVSTTSASSNQSCGKQSPEESDLNTTSQQETKKTMGKGKKQRQPRQTHNLREDLQKQKNTASDVTAMAANAMETTTVVSSGATSSSHTSGAVPSTTKQPLRQSKRESKPEPTAKELFERLAASSNKANDVDTSSHGSSPPKIATNSASDASEDRNTVLYDRSTSSLVSITKRESITRSNTSHPKAATDEKVSEPGTVPYLSKEASARLKEEAKTSKRTSTASTESRRRSDGEIDAHAKTQINSTETPEQLDFYRKGKAESVIPPAGKRTRGVGKGSGRRLSQISQEQPEGIELLPAEDGDSVKALAKDDGADAEGYFMTQHPALESMSQDMSAPAQSGTKNTNSKNESKSQDMSATTQNGSKKSNSKNGNSAKNAKEKRSKFDKDAQRQSTSSNEAGATSNDDGVDMDVGSGEKQPSPSSSDAKSLYVNPHLLKLYESARENEGKRKKMAEELGKEYTFTPRTNARKSNDLHSSPEQVSERLYSQAKELQVKRDYAPPKGADYKFSPQVNRDSEKYKKVSEERKGKKVYDHLYSEALSQRERLEEKKKHYWTKDCTFEPELTTKAWKKRLTAPAAERLHSPDSENGSIKKAPEDSREKECTFHPKINTVRQKDKQGVRPPPVYERLYSEYSKQQEDILERKKSEEEKSMKECTFKPKLYSQPNDVSNSSVDAYTRLYEHAKEKHRRDSDIGTEVHPFKPSISPGSKKAPARRSTGEGSRWEQLYHEGKLRVHARNTDSPPKKDYTDDDRMNCTFQPNKYGNAEQKVSQKDRRFMDELPVHDRLYQHARNVQAVKQLTLSGDMPFVEQEITEDGEDNTAYSSEEQGLYLI